MMDLYKRLAGVLVRELGYPSEHIRMAADYAIDDLVGTGMDVFNVPPEDVAERLALVIDTHLRVWGADITQELNAYGRSCWVADVGWAFGKAQAVCRSLAAA